MTTAEQTTTPESPDTTDEQRATSRYIIFTKVSDSPETWEVRGVIETEGGAFGARMEAVEKYDLISEIRSGDVEMVSLGERFWKPKRPTVNVQETISGF